MRLTNHSEYAKNTSGFHVRPQNSFLSHRYGILPGDFFAAINSLEKVFGRTGSVTQAIYCRVDRKQESAESATIKETVFEEIVGEEQIDENVMYREESEDVVEEVMYQSSDSDQAYVETVEQYEEVATSSSVEDVIYVPPPQIPDPPNYRRRGSGGNFPCTFCSKSFPSNASLITHIRTHTNERPFQCGYCEKAFKQKGALKVHLRLHTGESPYSCRICDKCFRQYINLQCHIRKAHGLALEAIKRHTVKFR